MGALCGAGIIYANYIHAIDLFEGGRHIRTVPGTASLFSTYAVSRPGLSRACERDDGTDWPGRGVG